MATSISIFIHNIVKTLVVYSLFKIQPFQLSTFKVILLTVLVFIVLNLIPFSLIDSHIVRILVRSISIGLVYSFVVIWFKIGDDINQLFHKLVRR